MSALAIGLLVLACGWKLYKDLVYTRYLALRNTGHPQYFGAALCAAYLFVLGVCLENTADASGFYQETISNALDYLPVVVGEKEKLGLITTLGKVSIWVIALAWILGRLINFPLHRSPSLLIAVARKTRIIDELEETLYYCLTRGLFVAITLKSGKVYIGVPKRHSPDHDRDRIWLSIWPVASGFRGESGALTITTYYPGKDRLLNSNGLARRLEDFQCVIPLAEISSVQSFDLETYANFPRENTLATTEVTNEISSEKQVIEAKPPFPPIYPGIRNGFASRLVNVIITKRERYLLRMYSYFIATVSATILLLPFSIWYAVSMALVSAISAIEAIEPIQVRWLNYNKRKALQAGPANRSEDTH